MKTTKYYENQSEKYGDIYPVKIEDYQELNPDGIFKQTPYGIYEYDEDGELIEQVAVITVDFNFGK